MSIDKGSKRILSSLMISISVDSSRKDVTSVDKGNKWILLSLVTCIGVASVDIYFGFTAAT